MTPEGRFEAFCARKTREAVEASLVPLVTLEDHSQRYAVLEIGTEWTRRMYDGAFHLASLAARHPAVSLVFVQSRDGNTVAPDPAALGGGAVDKHLLYEGLSRVAADAVLAGAATASGRDVFFSVWHPEIVALRDALGLPRHPAQIVVSGSGTYELGKLLAFWVPAAPVFILTSEEARSALEREAAGRPWVRIVGMPRRNLRHALAVLRGAHGIARISAVGGPQVATALVDADLVQDVYLTTTGVSGGTPRTPFYTGPRALGFDTIAAKQGTGDRGPITIEHSWLRCETTAHR